MQQRSSALHGYSQEMQEETQVRTVLALAVRSDLLVGPNNIRGGQWTQYWSECLGRLLLNFGTFTATLSSIRTKSGWPNGFTKHKNLLVRVAF
jgi:hypothetical protein